MQKYSEEQIKLIEELNIFLNPIEDSDDESEKEESKNFELLCENNPNEKQEEPEYTYDELKSKLERYKRGDFS